MHDLGIQDDSLDDDLNFERKHKYILSFDIQFTLELLDKWQVAETVLPHMCFYFSYAYPYSYTRMKTVLLPKVLKYTVGEAIVDTMQSSSKKKKNTAAARRASLSNRWKTQSPGA